MCKKCQVHFKNITSCDYESSRLSKKIEPRAKGQLKACEPVNYTSPKSIPQRESSESSEGDGILSDNVQAKRILSWSRHSAFKPACCNCPCHHPGIPPSTGFALISTEFASVEFTNMLLDAVFGICRICGNLPNLSPYTRDCNPVMSDTVLMAGRIDPFQVLPAESTPRVHALMHHCTSWNSQEAPPSTNIENREYNSSSFPNPDPLPILHQSSLALSSHRQPHPVQHHIVCGGYPRCWTSRL